MYFQVDAFFVFKNFYGGYGKVKQKRNKDNPKKLLPVRSRFFLTDFRFDRVNGVGKNLNWIFPWENPIFNGFSYFKHVWIRWSI